MSWESIYLLCFLVGLGLSLVSLLTAGLNLHLPGGHHHGGAHVEHAVPLNKLTHAGQGKHGASPFSFATFTAFLAWFGGTGYLLERYSGTWALLALGAAVLMGFVGAWLVFWFLARLLTHERDLDPADYDMTGLLARVTSGIHVGGTGEIVYSQAGSRHTCGARSEEGAPIPRGTTVVVLRYERGLAYVRSFEEDADGSPWQG